MANQSPIDEWLNEFPTEVRDSVQTAWQKLPVERQKQLVELVPSLPTGDVGGWQQLLELARAHADMAFGQKQRVAIVGPTNVGKSTLYNRLIADDGPEAMVSAVPGTTRAVQTADRGVFTVADTPGMGAGGAAGERDEEVALSAARQADFLLIMFDAVQGVGREEMNLFHVLAGLGRPYVVVLNKMDTVSRWEKRRVVGRVAELLSLSPEKIVPISAADGDNVGTILTAVVKSEPALLAALGRAMPAYRRRLAWQAIFRAASSAAVIALTPIPLMDFVPLTAVQGMLVLSIARVYRYELTVTRARELAGSLGMGYLGRMGFYQLTRLGGPPAWLISAAVAAGTTVAVGYAAVIWFEQSRRVDADQLKRMSQRVVRELLQRLPSWRKRPSRDELSSEIGRALEEVSMVEDDENRKSGVD